jgi:DNA-binding CsgD family transcriptional regulator
MLQQAFGLTPAEAQTASLMGSGLSPQDTADQLGLTVGTIRCELKAIFAKVGISRQSELASTVTRLALLIPNCGDYQGSCINSVYLDEKFLGDPEVSSFSGPIRAQERRWCMDMPTY